MEDEKYIGYIKYEGSLVKDGLMDARKQADALLGFDYAIRHIISKEAPELRNIDFEIPLRVRKGSWEALIPETVAGWVTASLGVAATGYLTKAAQKMAEKDFSDFGIKDIFRSAVEALKWVVKIGKHMGDLSIKQFHEIKFIDNNSLIGIKNDKGDFLYVPKHILDLYAACSPKLLEKLTAVIEEGRELKIGSVHDGIPNEVIISKKDKKIFCSDEETLEEDILFPELVHGEQVTLEGEVTRENKTSNSMGFKYQEHILTAYPESGNIVPYKPILFLKCRLHGVVNRMDENGKLAARRPKLVFSHLEPLEDEKSNGLF